MKLLILSDIHANPYALRAVLETETDADRIVFAGDAVDYGPDPHTTIALLRECGALCVRGNHDNKLLGLHAGEAPGTWGDLCARRMTEADRAWFGAQPEVTSFTADGIPYLLAHRCGTGYETLETRYAFDRYLARQGQVRTAGEFRMIFGHTHRQCVHMLGGGRMWINPGSVSYRRPDEPSKEAFYATITDGVIDLKHIPYDRQPLREALHALRTELNAAEYRVGDFFFDKEEADGAME